MNKQLEQTPPRYTIGFLTVDVHKGFGQLLWSGVNEYAKKHNLNLLVVPIHQWPPNPEDSFSTQSSDLHKLLTPGSVDGLIVWTAGILKDHSLVDQFLAQFQPLPTVSLGIQATNVPSMTCDNYEPMYQIVSHLIEQCGRKHIAYITPPRGTNSEVDIRYHAYVNALRAHGLPLNENLIAYSSFVWESRMLSAAAVTKLLSNSAVQIDAIVGASDQISLGAVAELQRRGIQIPQEIAVTGYDNIKESLAIWPPLTTVDQLPFIQGWQAGKILHSILQDGVTVQNLTISPQPLIRISSGWSPKLELTKPELTKPELTKPELTKPELTNGISNDLQIRSSTALIPAQKTNEETQRKLLETFCLRKEELQQTMSTKMKNTVGNPTNNAESLTQINKFLNEFQYLLECGDERFLSEYFSQNLSLNYISGASISAIESAFQIPFDWFDSYLREEEIVVTDSLEKIVNAVAALWQQVKLLLSIYWIKISGKSQLNAENQQAILMKASRTLLSPFDREKFAQIFTIILPQLEINLLYVTQFSTDDHPTDDLRTVFAYENGECKLDTNQNAIDAIELIASLYKDERRSLIVSPLFWGNEANGHVGILVSSGNISGQVNNDFNVILGQSVKSANLLERIKNHTSELEERVVERTQRLQEANETLTNEIAERQRYEKRLEIAKEAAEAATRAKSQFLATISHEIRTPMNGVTGMTSLLLETEINDEQYDYVETIRRSSESLLTIINDILDFSKTELGHMDIEQQEFNIDECVQEAIDLIAPVTSAKNIELIYSRDENVPEIIIGDATRTRQILVNLTSNASKFTETGEIMVSIHLKEQVEDRITLHFSVCDTGIGIRAEKIPLLFDPFTQADSSITRRFGGTGLGLSISKRLCEVMGGQMWVDSVSGVGSTFHFTLKMLAHGRAKKTAPIVFKDNQKLVLILDDDGMHRKILATHIQRFGLKTEVVSSIEEAEAVLQTEQKFDAMVIDNFVSGTDGLKAAKALCLSGLPAACPVILLVPLTTNDLKRRAKRFGISFVITKPVKMKDLRSVFVKIFGVQQEGEHRTRARSDFDILLSEKHPLNILLAEDNVVNQKVAQHILQRLGYRIDIVSDGTEAVEAVRRQNYDIVLMDVQMPNMDGLEATKRIIQESAVEQCPLIIAMTAGAMQEDSQRCFEAGMRDFVSKPIQIPKLIDVLTRAAEQIDAAHAEIVSTVEIL